MWKRCEIVPLFMPLFAALLLAAADPAVPAVVSSASPAPLMAGAPSAEAIFESMREALLARRYPKEISYSVRIEGLGNKVWHGRTYDAFAFPLRDEVREKTVSREENADPFHPGEFGFDVLGQKVAGGGDAPPDALGVPKLSPAYAFGLIPAPHRPKPAPGATPAAGYEIIGSATAIAKIYDVTLVGPEDALGLPCWHLKLKPIGNAGTYRVRDVWVTRDDSQLVELKTDGNFTSPDTGEGLWTVTYTKAPDGSWYITDETSDGSVTAEDSTYDQMRVRFSEIKPQPKEIYDVGVPTETLKLLTEP